MTRRWCLLLFVPALAVAFAQGDGNPSDRAADAKQRLAELKQRLNLTPDQEERVRPVITEEVQQAKAVMAKYDLSNLRPRDKMRLGRELKGVRESADKQLKAILTPAQMQELRRYREERRDEMKKRMQER